MTHRYQGGVTRVVLQMEGGRWKDLGGRGRWEVVVDSNVLKGETVE